MLQEVKNYLQIAHNHADKNLKALVEEGTAAMMSYCGPFDVNNNYMGRSLIKDYVRFHFNGVGEQFYECYKSKIIKFGFDLMESDSDVSKEAPNL
ncbi:hypothetical protein NHG24_08090 [Aerococcaceae bacterium NML210727]|nr:hypothetical protein [Aerococcaceae bacterium NML210727]MCW6655080.1 hypothetical protein [Aerococcaceae bacterium NML201296]